MLTLLLILAPFAVGLVLLFLRSEFPRRILVTLATLAACGGTIALAALPTPGALPKLPIADEWISRGVLAVEILMGLYVIYVGLRARRLLIVALMLVQGGVMVWFEFACGAHLKASSDLFVDNFAIIMALINGIVGGGICLYALGYMREYHEKAHCDVPDGRPYFLSCSMS